MKERLLLHICQECCQEFLFKSDVEDHKADTNHRLFITREINEFPLTIDPEQIKSLPKEFSPNVATLQRITNALLERGPLTRTALSQAANVHYSRLSKCLMLLSYRGHVEYSMSDGKTIVKLTDSGKRLALQLASIISSSQPHHSRPRPA